eukprot:s694_g12.t1
MKPSPAFEAAPHWITVGEQGDPEGSELERQWDECFEGMLSRRDAEPSSSKLVRHNRYDAMARGLKTAQWMSNGALAAAVKVGANRRMRLRCEQEDLMNELHCERQAAEELQTELSSEMRELRDRCQEQGQTVGLLTQRLADARSAIAAELQDAAAERAALGAELSEESQRNRLQAAMLHEEAEATSRVEAYEQQLASMVTVRDSLQAQLEAALRVQTELREHLAAERDGRAELEVAGEREMLAWEKNKEMTHSPGTELQSLGTIHTAKLGNHLPRIFGKINRPTRVSEEPQKSAEEEAPPAPQKKQPPLEAPKLDDSVLAEAKLVVESIRADRLVNCEWEEGITDEVKAGLLGMRRSLCAAVERLAMDLYADECHCLWELIQNADDNKYASEVEVPELCLSMEVDASLGAYVWTSNNEIGLSREDVRAICNVNASMKGAGQTGHKGIGWKSVFRISDCPHVLSREFAFKFDTAGPLGQLAYVTPTNLTDEEIESLPSPVKEAKAAGRTVMFLPLRSVSDAPAVEAELKQIAAQHLCLAFLRRLRRLQLCFPDGRRMTLERCQAQFAELYFPAASDVTAVKITDAHKAQEPRIQMPAYVLHHQSVTWEDEAEAEGGESTAKLSLAFPASFASREDDADEDESELLQVPLQALFTFLPVKVVGFRFAIQGPFDLTADRANLHGKSSRNRALCSAIPMAFRTALEQLPSLRRNALDLLGQETPEAAWLLVRGELLEVLREVACIPTEPEGALARPGECLLPPEEQKLAEAMQHLPSDVLWARCRRRLVRKKWAQSHRAQCRALGLKEISIDDWLHVLGVAAQGEDLTSETTRSLVEEAAGKQDHGFFRRVFALLGSNVTDKPEVLDQLKTVPLIPDAAGHALRIVDGPTFSNHAGDVPLEWQNALEAAGALRVLSPAVQTALDSVGQRLLRQLGVTRPTRHDIVPLCVRWHTSLSPESARSSDDPKSADHEQEEAHPNRQGNLQCGGSSGSDAAPRQDVEPVDQHARAKSGDCQQPAPLDKATLRSGVWASLACLRNHFLTGAAGAPHEKGGEMVPWRELGNGLLFPCSSRRSGFGPCQRLTCPTYFGEAVGSELQHDVLVAIMGFIHGIEAEAHDIGVCSDPPPPWLRDEKEKVSESKDALTTDRLNWEAFLDDLGLKPLSPCTSHRKVAGTILTIDLGWRLSSSDWWKAAAASKAALAYLERRLKEADRLEITWLKQLRTPERVDVAELFLRSAYVRYGGHFLPYMDLPQTDAPVASLACLRRLGVATDLTGSGLRKCLQVLEGRACQDLSVFADIYAALASLPKDEQASTGSWGSQEAPGDARVFLPPATFRKAGECVWTDHGKSTLRWLCGYVALQPDYGRFGNLCRSWLVGPHVAIKHDLEALEASAFLGALRSLIRQADAASRIAPSDRQKRLAGSDSPTAAALLHELQDVAVQAYKHLAKCCRAATGEDRSRVQGSIALAFQHEALLILTDKEWDKPKRLKSLEAFWDVHADVASSKASKLALKNRLPAEDLDELKTFFVDIVGIPERLSQQDLEARLRVPLSQAPEQQSSWNEGFGLNDFEDIATIRRGPGVVGQAGEGDDFFQPADDLPEGAATYGSGSTGRTAYDTRVSGPDEAGVSSTSGPAASSSEPAGAANTSAPRSSDEPPADSPAGDPEQAASSQEPSASSQQPGQTLPDEPEEEEEDAFDWESEDACDPYKVLRVDKDADEETIRRSYKKLALKYHPDKNQGSETAQKRFQAISAAYDILRDPEKRKAYDKAAARAKAQKSQASQVRPPSMSPEEAREVFRDFFGGRDPFDAAFRNQPPKRAEGAASSSSDAFRVSDAAPSSAPSSSQGSGKSTTSSSRSYRRPKHRLGCGARRWKWRASSFARRRRPGIGTCEFCKIAMTAPAREAREDSDGSRGAKQSALWLTEGPWHQELHQNDGLRSLNGLCVVSTEKNLSTGSGALLF